MAATPDQRHGTRQCSNDGGMIVGITTNHAVAMMVAMRNGLLEELQGWQNKSITDTYVRTYVRTYHLFAFLDHRSEQLHAAHGGPSARIFFNVFRVHRESRPLIERSLPRQARSRQACSRGRHDAGRLGAGGLKASGLEASGLEAGARSQRVRSRQTRGHSRLTLCAVASLPGSGRP